MRLMAIVERLAGVFDEVFGFDREKFALDLGPEDVANWDSIGHMNMVMHLEKEFGRQFDVDEIMEMSSPAKIVEILRSKGVEE